MMGQDGEEIVGISDGIGYESRQQGSVTASPDGRGIVGISKGKIG